MEKESSPVASRAASARSFRVKSIAVTGLFATLSLILTLLSQAMGLNFPLVPYLQFDFGELAILMAFFIVGPWSGLASAVVEFVALLAIGQNVPIGPVSKIVAIVTSLAGIWLGIKLSSRISSNLKVIAGSGLALGIVSRVAFMTILNYYLVVYVYQISGIIYFLQTPLKLLLGINLNDSNTLFIVLALTALFNSLQLAMGFIIARILTGLPQVKRSLRSSRLAWFESIGTRREQRKTEL